MYAERTRYFFKNGGIPVRALLDSGSEQNLMDVELAKQDGILDRVTSLSITGRFP